MIKAALGSVRMVLLAVALICSGIAARGADELAKAPNGDFDAELKSLMKALASSDAAESAKASEGLRAMGVRARAALVAAVNSDHADARQAATRLLLEMPFDRAEDAADVKALLQTYGQGDVAARKVIVGKLGLAIKENVGVLLRLAAEDPSDDVRWAIVMQVRRVFETVTPDRVLPIDRAPNLALAGLAWDKKEPDRALALMEKALAQDDKDPTTDPGIVLTYYDLAARYTSRRRYDEAAEIHRRAIKRAPSARITHGNESTDHLELLFNLHARFGPLKGFEDDLQTYAQALGRPYLQYMLGRIYERSGKRLVADSLYRVAFMNTAPGWKAHHEMGALLLQLRMIDQAELQFETALAATSNIESFEAVETRLQLAQILTLRGADFAAAEVMRSILEGPLPPNVKFEYVGRDKLRNDDAQRVLEAQMHWHYLRAARAKKDVNSIKAHLKEIVRLLPDIPEIVLDVAPLLIEQGRTEDAARLFAAPYERAKMALDAQPANPVRMNDLAWLCARWGQHLDEAKKLSDAAIAMEPNNGGFLDTAAEVSFRRGDIDQAIKYETRAIELRADDPFLREQLKRFTDAKAAH
jgi:tetratricopeptide (TPR) repeat protein